MSIPVVYLGEDWRLPVQALEAGAAYPLSGGDLPAPRVVQAGLVDPATEALLVGPVDVDLGAAGSSPGVGLCVPVFTAAAIAAGQVQPGLVLLELVIDGQTWQRATLRVHRGAIP